MKKISILFFLVFIFFDVSGQEIIKHLSPNLVVVADDLNFRKTSSTNSPILGKLHKGEKLTLLGIVESEDGSNDVFFGFDGRWLKVRNATTGEIGFVFGDYVRSQNAAYRNQQDCSRIQSGNWYGLYYDKRQLYMDRVNPEIQKSLDGYQFITSDSSKYQFFVCSETKFEERKVDGAILSSIYSKDGYIGINTMFPLTSIGKNEFHIVCTGTVTLKDGYLERTNEELFFVKTTLDGGNRSYFEQNLSQSILKYGEVGYKVEFAGDLNRDGVPELIISEADTRKSALYFFLSNAEGNLVLQSITWGYSNC